MWMNNGGSGRSLVKAMLFVFIMSLPRMMYGEAASLMASLMERNRTGLRLPYSTISGKHKIRIRQYFISGLVRLRQAMEPHMAVITYPGASNRDRITMKKGILITYHSFHARRVQIGGDFNQWNKEDMRKNPFGVWYYLIEYKKSMDYVHYRLCVDDVWVTNPLGEQRFIPDIGGFVSVALFEFPKTEKFSSSEVSDQGVVIFKIYAPKAHRVTVVGNFNDWNLWHDYMERSEEGSWKLVKRLPPGRYLYRFYVDTEWKLDLYNPKTRRDMDGDVWSYLEVPPGS